MVIAAVPVGKILLLAVKTVAKPVTKVIKNNAKKSQFFKKWIVMPPAQAIHWMDVKVKTTLLGVPQAKVYRLNDKLAVEHGAEFLGEFLIYALGAVIIIYEYTRSVAKDEEKGERIKAEKEQMRSEMDRLYSANLDIQFMLERQDMEMRALQRQIALLQPTSALQPAAPQPTDPQPADPQPTDPQSAAVQIISDTSLSETPAKPESLD